MATKKKNSTKKVIEEQPVATEQVIVPVEEEKTAPAEEIVAPKVEKPVKKVEKKATSKQRFPVGALVYVSKDAEADLNGFCLFSQYKRDPYTVEAYDADRGVYTLRRQKLLIRLSEDFILAPDENAHDSINRKQF